MLKSTVTVNNLIKLYLTLELRQKQALFGVLIQMFASVLLIYLSIISFSLPVWNALFWLMVLFNTMNTIAKGFLQESEGKMFYYHSITNPQSLILSKIIYNALVSLILLLGFCLAYFLVLGYHIQNIVQYLMVAFLFTIGLSAVFTMVSAIAAGAGNNALLIPVLGLPLMIPLILMTVKTAKKAMDGIETTGIYFDLSALALMDLMLIYLAVMLYKFLWKNG